MVLAVGSAGVAGLHHRDASYPAVVVESPGMVGAAEKLAAIAVAVADHHVAAVGTAVVEDVHLAVGAAHHHHRLAAHLHGVVVAGLRHPALVAARGAAPLL